MTERTWDCGCTDCDLKESWDLGDLCGEVTCFSWEELTMAQKQREGAKKAKNEKDLRGIQQRRFQSQRKKQYRNLFLFFFFKLLFLVISR